MWLTFKWKARLGCHDHIRQPLEGDEGKGRFSICAHQKVRDKPRADNAAEAQRKRQHPHDRHVLQDTPLPGRRHNAVCRGRRRAIDRPAFWPGLRLIKASLKFRRFAAKEN